MSANPDPRDIRRDAIDPLICIVQCRRGKLGPLAAELVFGESSMLANLSRQSAQVDR